MTGPGSSMVIGGGSAIFLSALFGSDALWIAAFGGFGGLSRWLYLTLISGEIEPWYKGVAQVLLSIMFVSGVFPIAVPLMGVLFNGSDFIEGLSIDPSANLGVAYFFGMFTTVLIGLFEDKIRSKKSDEAKNVED